MSILQSRQSEAFLALAECGSFEQAADKLHITASAVTLRIQNLEKQLGQVLIVRDRPCRVTAAGQELLQHLQQIQLMEQHLTQQLQGKSSDSAFYQLKIASNADSLATWLLPLLKQTLSQEKITLHFHVDDQSETHHLLEAGLVNACVSAEASAMKGCVASPLGTMHYHFCCTPEFAQQWFSHGVHRETLRDAPAVIFNAKDQMHTEYIQREFGLHSSQYPHFFVPSSTAFVDAVTMGLGYGWLPFHQAKSYFQDKTLLEIAPELCIDLPLYWHHWKQQSAPLQTLTQLLTTQARYFLNG